MKIKESEILERIGAAIDGLWLEELAGLHNQLTDYEYIDGFDIEPSEGWHLIPKEGGH